MSTRPCAATTLVMNAWTCPRSATSTGNPAAPPPAASISSTAGGIAPSFLSAMMTNAPSLANRCAIALPIPEAAPVTIATFSFRRIAALLRSSSRLSRARIDLRAISLLNIGEQFARRRRVDQVLARELAGDLAHGDRKLGDLDHRDQPVENRSGIDLMHASVGQHSHQAPAGRDQHFSALFKAALCTFGNLSDDLGFRLVIAKREVKDAGPLHSHLVHRDQARGEALQLDALDDAMRELRIDVDEREGRAHQASNMNRRIAEPEYGDIEQFPQLVQPGIEDIAEYEGVVAFFLGPQPVIHDLGLIQEFKVAVLLGYCPVRA